MAYTRHTREEFDKWLDAVSAQDVAGMAAVPTKAELLEELVGVTKRAEQAERERDEALKDRQVYFECAQRTRCFTCLSTVREGMTPCSSSWHIAETTDSWERNLAAIRKERDEARAKVERLTAAAKEYHEEDGQCSWGFDLCKPCPLCAALEDSK